MVLIASRKLNEYGNSLTWELDRENSSFCCEKLKNSHESFDIRTSTDFPTPFLRLKSGDDYYTGEYTDEENVEFCPFCGLKITVDMMIIDKKIPRSVCDDCGEIIKTCDESKHEKKHALEKLASMRMKIKFQSLD